jgi:hypothetical protein
VNGLSMLRRPIYGGAFGQGQYELATQPIIAKGLHAVKFFVLEPRAGRVLSIAESKLEALSGARRVLHGLSAATSDEPAWHQSLLWGDSGLAVVDSAAHPRPVSRRRREIFERSGGRCHYCPQVLTLDGKWHAEHQMPRALGGTDEPGNLVAACVRCNLAKRDRTALEFVTDPAASTAPARMKQAG